MQGINRPCQHDQSGVSCRHGSFRDGTARRYGTRCGAFSEAATRNRSKSLKSGYSGSEKGQESQGREVSPSDEEFFEKVRRIVLDQQRELAELRASVRVLRVVVARLANKDQPQAFLADLSQWEKQVLDADSLDQQRRQSAEILEALDLLKKRGATGQDS